MDAYLTAETVRTLQAARIFSGRGKGRGFLLGHRRGSRIFVESVYFSPSASWPSLKDFYRLDDHFEGKIVGFFLEKTAPADRKLLLQPYGVGKILIEGRPTRKRAPAYRGFLIDFENRFVMRTIPVIAENPSGNEEKTP